MRSLEEANPTSKTSNRK